MLAYENAIYNIFLCVTYPNLVDGIQSYGSMVTVFHFRMDSVLSSALMDTEHPLRKSHYTQA